MAVGIHHIIVVEFPCVNQSSDWCSIYNTLLFYFCNDYVLSYIFFF